MFDPMECYANNESFDGLFDKAKKKLKRATGAAGSMVKTVTKPVVKVATKTTVGKLITAPLVAPTAFALKGTTYALGKTGIKPFQKLDSAVGKAYRSSEVGALRRTYGVQVATGAAVGATLLSGGTAAPALIAGLPGAISLATGKASSASIADTVKIGLTGAIAGQVAIAGGNVAESIPSISSSSAPTEDAALAQTMAITGATEVPVTLEATTAVDAAQSAVASAAAGAPAKTSVLPLAAAAGAGFLVFGPIGAVAGAAAGALLGRKKA